ncbi:MAG: FUSC family protein [Actinomycetales bacterium]|jgi:uncharacterized membrane protein YgaE (UPF0421/DUF939 family)|uniref:FUSC family protein n=1 Tax=Candidatus Phosphoribacter hodrii TaxID=2953743 RepID=A0A935IIY3_9MICO|nr:FUSC family protein [Candidatus Phosphoribacter hodrii]MBP8838892.1 FUSC family protein [Dermatophilaceae bacterium]OPZ55508.1 MAG: hypothetical protein BWY91_00989 [bacterium ADurb.BinA028]MBL0004856.1 FUSC family protein [Candidatus Phosphoribacter hodrii]HNV14116.1 FUSC family protein [Dermatophilaceae bacterium]
MAALAFRDPRLEAAVERAWARSRLSLRTRVDRLVDKSWHVVQCAVAAGVAWWFASGVLHHAMPFFAPIVAVVCLGMTYGQRLRRVAEVTVGVAVGIAVADIFVGVVGSGPWQITVVVLVSMSLALLLDAGLLLVMQSAVQSIVVTVLVPTGSQALGRWVDAVIGGVVALVFAMVVPRAPLRRPRRQAARVGRVMARLLREAAQSAREGDVERSAQVLADARQTDPLIRELQAAADEGMSVIASTPFTRTDAGSVRSIASVVDPLDRAMRSTRVLVRRMSIAADSDIEVPDDYVDVIVALADAVDILDRVWAENRSAEFARPGFVALAERTATLDPGEYHTTVILAQLRSLVVDLLELSGMDHEDAVAAVPPLG